MIYLFNSAFRPLYVNNVIKTLFLPNGFVNEYRYGYTGPHPYIEAGRLEEFKKSKKEDVLIIFIDRFNSEGYFYHPLRKGTLLSADVDGNRLFFRVKLGEFVYPHNNSEFSDLLAHTINGLPRLKNNDPTTERDGYYAIKSTDITANRNFLSGNEAWERITDSLQSTTAFRSDERKETVYGRLSLRSHTIFKPKPAIENNVSTYKIIKRQTYSLELYYKYPNIASAEPINLIISTGSSINLHGDTTIPINNISNRETISFSSKKYVEERNDKLQLSFIIEPNKNNKLLIAPSFSIDLKISESRGFWWQIVIAIFILVIAEIISSLDKETLNKLTLMNFLDNIPLIVIISAFIKIICLLWIFRLIGKKVL